MNSGSVALASTVSACVNHSTADAQVQVWSGESQVMPCIVRYGYILTDSVCFGPEQVSKVTGLAQFGLRLFHSISNIKRCILSPQHGVIAVMVEIMMSLLVLVLLGI